MKKSAVGGVSIFVVIPRNRAITIIFNNVPSPRRNLRGFHTNITAQLIKKDDQPISKFVCIAIPCESTVQGVDPKPDNTISPSPIPKIERAKSKIEMVLYCAVHNDVAAQDVRGITRTFFFIFITFYIPFYHKRKDAKTEIILSVHLYQKHIYFE